MTRIVFQGDSITDVMRDRQRDWYPGMGYPAFINGKLGVDHPGKYQVINRGVSGNRVPDLYARIKCDILNLAPDILSVLIGINDVWHEIGSQNGVDAEKFYKVYDLLLDEVEAALPGTKIVVMEPFVLEGTATCACEERPDRWEYFRTECALRAEKAQLIARKHSALFVPLQRVFDKACESAPSGWWLVDGVHPTGAGHELIAREWLRAMGL